MLFVESLALPSSSWAKANLVEEVPVLGKPAPITANPEKFSLSNKASSSASPFNKHNILNVTFSQKTAQFVTE